MLPSIGAHVLRMESQSTALPDVAYVMQLWYFSDLLRILEKAGFRPPEVACRAPLTIRPQTLSNRTSDPRLGNPKP